MMPKDDWRRRRQEDYLTGVRLYHVPFTPLSEQWDHGHCEFCFEKFFLHPDHPECIREGSGRGKIIYLSSFSPRKSDKIRPPFPSPSSANPRHGNHQIGGGVEEAVHRGALVLVHRELGGDPRFPQEVLHQHGAFLADGVPWAFRVVSDRGAVVTTAQP